MNYNFKEEKDKILKEIKQMGYNNKFITYKEFLKLYEPYKTVMSEIDFIDVVGIKYGAFRNLKIGATAKTKILDDKNHTISEERKDELRNEFIIKGFKNKVITYNEFLELYEPYKVEMSEKEFSNVLGLTHSSYQNMKSTNCRGKVLKQSFNKMSEERREEIRNELIKYGFENKLITYKEFLEIYELYKKEISEVDFAELIGIKYSCYIKIKNTEVKTKILKHKKSQMQGKKEEEIRSILIEKGYKNKLITYNEFLELYEPYKTEIPERRFADILEIKYGCYYGMKKNNQRTRILKYKNEELSEERKEEIKSEFAKREFKNKKIGYNEFLELYEPYKVEMSERIFAEIIGIAYSNYTHLKYRTSRTKILKEEFAELKEETKDEIRKELTKQDIANTSVTYTKFLDIYKQYKSELSEINFAEIMGICLSSYQDMKYKGRKFRVNFDKKIYQRIKYCFKDSGIYDYLYFQKIAEKYNCTIQEIIEMLYKNDTIVELMYKSLVEKKAVYIGDKKLEEELSKEKIEELNIIIHKISYQLGIKLRTEEYSSDLAQDVIIKILKKGNVIKNFGEEVGWYVLKKYAITCLKRIHLAKMMDNNENSFIRLDEEIESDRRRKENVYNDNIKSKDNVEETVIVSRIEDEILKEKCGNPIQVMRVCLENGMDKLATLDYVQEKFKLTQVELIGILTKELECRNQER